MSTGALLLVGALACGSDEDQPRTREAQTPSVVEAQPSPTNAPSTSPATVVIDDAIWKRVRSEGTVVVIVTLNVPYQPESQLSGQAAIDAQRSAIAEAQDELVASLSEGQAEVITRMDLLPQIVLKVDEPALRQLASSPLVLAVQENALSSPTGRRPIRVGGRL